MQAILCARERHPPVIFYERVRDRRYGKHEVYSARQNCVPRHPVISGLIGILGDHQPAFLLHGFQPEAAISRRSGEDYANDPLAVFLRERAQQKIERQPRAVTRLRLREMESIAADRKIGPGRNDIEIVPLEWHPICGLAYPHGGMAGQQLNHHAFVGRVEMLDKNESHAVADAEALHELSARFEAARRRAHPDDQKVIPALRRAAHRRRSPVRSSTRRFGLGWTPSGHFMRTASGNAPSWNRLLQVITGALTARLRARRPGWPNGLRSFRACYRLSHIGYGPESQGPERTAIGRRARYRAQMACTVAPDLAAAGAILEVRPCNRPGTHSPRTSALSPSSF